MDRTRNIVTLLQRNKVATKYRYFMQEEKLFTTLLSPEKTMELVLDAIKELVDYELAVVLSYEQDNTLRVRKARGPLVSDQLKNHILSLTRRNDIKSILEKGEVHLFDEREAHIDTYQDIIELPDGHSCLVAPLQLSDTKLGLLTLDHSACNMFTPEVVNITATLSKIISLALAQTMAAESLRLEKEALIHQRISMLSESTEEFKNMLGNSKAWLNVLNKIKMVAPSNIPVMITGETGTGKEQAARAIHQLSDRKERPFVALNCSALASGIAESELFGHEKGAFTGAVGQRKGRFEIANTGTLFLDEIGDLPVDIQPKLLRAIQEGTFERVGGEKQLNSDVRIICATHVDLPKAISEGKFREDLYYRLNVFPLGLPPLRERENDVLLIAEHFINEIAKKRNIAPFSFSDSAIHFITGNRWKGNVRELQNTLQRASVLSRNGVITINELKPNQELTQQILEPEKKDEDTLSSLDVAIKTHIKKALVFTDGKIYGDDGAAQLLGLKPTTLQSKMKKLGIS